MPNFYAMHLSAVETDSLQKETSADMTCLQTHQNMPTALTAFRYANELFDVQSFSGLQNHRKIQAERNFLRSLVQPLRQSKAVSQIRPGYSGLHPD